MSISTLVGIEVYSIYWDYKGLGMECGNRHVIIDERTYLSAEYNVTAYTGTIILDD